MRKIIAIGLILLTITAFFSFSQIGQNLKTIEKKTEKEIIKLEDGDIILQTSESAQCEAVRIATNSKFSHCGIIFKDKSEVYVIEAVQPVKITSFKEWITHGKNNSYLIKRLKKSEKILTSNIINKMKSYGKSLINKDYDLYFEWSDDKIYCSELVWKVYKEGAGVEICPFKKLKDFNLNSPIVQNIMQQRYGSNIPYNEKVIAPSQIAESELLTTVIDTYKN
ncbi:MAG: YiiX family permuted papain-like enzyme [Limnohabitans sp.]|nr:YiiX family permuted papain-like enzyme [Limnohabitans sp.]